MVISPTGSAKKRAAAIGRRSARIEREAIHSHSIVFFLLLLLFRYISLMTCMNGLTDIFMGILIVFLSFAARSVYTHTRTTCSNSFIFVFFFLFCSFSFSFLSHQINTLNFVLLTNISSDLLWLLIYDHAIESFSFLQSCQILISRRYV